MARPPPQRAVYGHMQEPYTTSRRTDTDRRTDALSTEPSPSAGWRETATALHAPDAHAVDTDPTADADLIEELLMGSAERKGEPEVAI